MSVLVDTSVLVDVLRGEAVAAAVLREARKAGPLHGSDVTRREVLAGMRVGEESATRTLLGVLTWHPLDDRVAEVAHELGRQWLSSNRDLDSAGLVIAATAVLLDAPLLTQNVERYPMFAGLAAPY